MFLHAPSKFIGDPESITSNTSTYQLGFFSPANSTDRFVGIWFANRGIGPAKTVIWVANQNKPLKELSSGMLAMSEDGNLVLLNGKEEILWSSNIETPVPNTTAKILDSGNHVLLDNSNGNTIWESFQQHSNTFMPKTKLSTNLRTGKQVQLSWKALLIHLLAVLLVGLIGPTFQKFPFGTIHSHIGGVVHGIIGS